jgi:copper(I)-binding protein
LAADFLRNFMRNLFLLAVLVVALPLPAQADAGTAAVAAVALKIDAVWIRAVPPVSQNSAAYLRIRNSGAQDDFLLSVQTPVAASTELHDMVMNGDVMRMDKMNKARVPAGGELLFDPDSKHIMLLGLKAPVKVGQSVPLVLHFRKAGVVTVNATVRAEQP